VRLSRKHVALAGLALAVMPCTAEAAEREASFRSETVVVPNGILRLRAELWRPPGPGPFPAVLFNHGSGRPPSTPAGQQDRQNRLHEPSLLGPTFARHGYVFLYLFRRGEGLSAAQGIPSGERMAGELARQGQEGRNRVQLQLLETDDMGDALAGLAFLRALPEVDPRRVAVAGHSFGGSLTLLMAERDLGLRAAIVFAGAAGSWEGSPPLQARLLAAVDAAKTPVFLIYAANDYSVAPARVLGDEMARLQKPHRVKVYPPTGKTPDDGHRFVYLGVATWEPDVFAFLDDHMKR
jgi:dienelactone hydrolase